MPAISTAPSQPTAWPTDADRGKVISRYMGATPAPGQPGARASGRLGPEEAAEVRHGEGDQPPLRAVDQALLDQSVPRLPDPGRLAAQFLCDLRGRHRLVPAPRPRPHVLALPPG